ncbi:unnamed protein product, partial [Adineta ricciae]
YIKEVLPVALKYGNKIFGDDWIYQQDGATAHTHNLTQKWCKDNFPSFLDKEYWPPNSPDLNSLDYSIWDEFVQQMNWDNVQSKKTLINELKRTLGFVYQRTSEIKIALNSQAFVAARVKYFQILEGFTEDNAHLYYHDETSINLRDVKRSIWTLNGEGEIKKDGGK